MLSCLFTVAGLRLAPFEVTAPEECNFLFMSLIKPRPHSFISVCTKRGNKPVTSAGRRINHWFWWATSNNHCDKVLESRDFPFFHQLKSSLDRMNFRSNVPLTTACLIYHPKLYIKAFQQMTFNIKACRMNGHKGHAIKSGNGDNLTINSKTIKVLLKERSNCENNNKNVLQRHF